MVASLSAVFAFVATFSVSPAIRRIQIERWDIPTLCLLPKILKRAVPVL